MTESTARMAARIAHALERIAHCMEVESGARLRERGTPVDSCGLSARAQNVLAQLEVKTIEEASDLFALRSCGQGTVAEVGTVLREFDLAFAPQAKN